MAENMMNSAQKANSKAFNDNYDAIFRGAAYAYPADYRGGDKVPVCRCPPGDCLEGCGEEQRGTGHG